MGGYHTTNMLRTIQSLAGLLLALGSPSAPAAAPQCYVGSVSLCSCSELMIGGIIKSVDDCTQEAAIAACEDSKCVHEGDSERSTGFTDNRPFIRAQPSATDKPPQCSVGSRNLCSCSELMKRHLVKSIDDCTQADAIAACRDARCVMPSAMCVIPGKWYLNPLCWLEALGMVLISPFVFAWVALIYVVAFVEGVVHILVCALFPKMQEPIDCGGNFVFASQVENMDDDSKLLGGVMVLLVGVALCWYRYHCHTRGGKR